jgi:16S rRNA (guanine527-N7)-methyltransferase
MPYKNYDVPRGTIEQYIKLLLTWNDKINLVSLKDEQELIDRHILDSLQLMDYLEQDQVIFDIGSGAGFPGLMLSYAGIKLVHLVEKVRKKANFLTLAAQFSENAIKIHNQTIETIKAEVCDVITTRAFTNLDNILASTRNIAKPNTKYLLLKGRNIDEEIKKALENWKFKYIIHQSKTSIEGSVLILEQVERNE